jgi:hypothetical protein
MTPIFYLPLFKPVAKKLFFGRKNISGQGGGSICPPCCPPVNAYALEYNFNNICK